MSGMRTWGVVIAVLVLAACSEDLAFRHPVTGDVKVCKGGPNTGLAGITTGAGQNGCQDALWAQGYERVVSGSAAPQAPR